MRKLLLVVAVLLLIPVNVAFGQDSVKTIDNLVYSGIRYDDGLHLAVGYGKQIAGQLWMLQYADLGFNYGSWNSEICYFFRIGDKIYLGPLAGANTDWVNAGEDEPIVTYLVGATGGVFAYDFTGKVGCWCYFKYKFSMEDDNMYGDGWAIGTGLHLWF